MNKSAPHSSTTIDDASTMWASVNNVTKNDGRISEKAQVDRPALHNGAISSKKITTEQMTAYLHGVAAESIDEIEALMKHLRDLQENLAAHRARVEQGTMEFLKLNKSIGALTKIISDGAVQAEAQQPAEQP